MQRDLYVIAHDIRSAHNVGALFRLCDGLGIKKLFLTGYTPYPEQPDDERLPHIRDKLSKQIHKTALNAESSLQWEHTQDIYEVLEKLRKENVQIVGLEQSKSSKMLTDFHAPERLALLLGREVEGIDAALMQECDQLVEIPMLGEKESHNVIQAAAMALSHCRFVE